MSRTNVRGQHPRQRRLSGCTSAARGEERRRSREREYLYDFVGGITAGSIACRTCYEQLGHNQPSTCGERCICDGLSPAQRPLRWASRCTSAATPDWNAQPHHYRSHLLTRDMRTASWRPRRRRVAHRCQPPIEWLMQKQSACLARIKQGELEFSEVGTCGCLSRCTSAAKRGRKKDYVRAENFVSRPRASTMRRGGRFEP